MWQPIGTSQLCNTNQNLLCYQGNIRHVTSNQNYRKDHLSFQQYPRSEMTQNENEMKQKLQKLVIFCSSALLNVIYPMKCMSSFLLEGLYIINNQKSIRRAEDSEMNKHQYYAVVATASRVMKHQLAVVSLTELPEFHFLLYGLLTMVNTCI